MDGFVAVGSAEPVGAEAGDGETCALEAAQGWGVGFGYRGSELVEAKAIAAIIFGSKECFCAKTFATKFREKIDSNFCPEMAR